MVVTLETNRHPKKWHHVLCLLTGTAFVSVILNISLYGRLEPGGAVIGDELHDVHAPKVIEPALKNVCFPQWSDAKGLDFASIQAYLEYSLLPQNIRDRQYNILFPTHLFKYQFPSPNVLYAFGKEGAVWKDRFTLDPVKRFMKKDRYGPFERLLHDSFIFLKTNGSKTLNWARVRELVVEQNRSNGIPIIANLDDNRRCADRNLFHNKTDYSVPIFNLAVANPEINYCNNSFPVPTYSTMALVHEIEEADTRSIEDHWLPFQEQDTQFPWDKKIPTVVWRGTSSGLPPLSFMHWKYNANDTNNPHKCDVRKMLNPENASTYPLRLRTVYTAFKEMEYHNSTSSTTKKDKDHALLDFPLLDIHFYSSRYVKKEFPELREMAMIRPVNRFQAFKAVLDVDGNSWSERFARLLCMNSVVIKVKPEFVDYFWPTVKPWVHYVPVAQDSSDLWNMSKYVLDPDNHDEMRQIVQNAREWCKTHMKYEKLLEFMLDSISFYVNALDRHDRNWYERWEQVYKRQAYNRTWEAVRT